MDPADEMAAKIEPTEHPSAGAVAGLLLATKQRTSHEVGSGPKSEIKQTASLIPPVNRLPNSLVGSTLEQRRW